MTELQKKAQSISVQKDLLKGEYESLLQQFSKYDPHDPLVQYWMERGDDWNTKAIINWEQAEVEIDTLIMECKTIADYREKDNKEFRLLKLLIIHFEYLMNLKNAQTKFNYLVSINFTEELIEILLQDPRIDPSADNNIAIRIASASGYSKLVKLLLADGRIDPSANESEAFRNAVLHGHTEVVKLLLADRQDDPCRRVDPSARNNDALHTALRYQDLEILKILLDHSLLDDRIDISTISIVGDLLGRIESGIVLFNWLDTAPKKFQELENLKQAAQWFKGRFMY